MLFGPVGHPERVSPGWAGASFILRKDLEVTAGDLRGPLRRQAAALDLVRDAFGQGPLGANVVAPVGPAHMDSAPAPSLAP
jgi:hypothetical protein